MKISKFIDDMLIQKITLADVSFLQIHSILPSKKMQILKQNSPRIRYMMIPKFPTTANLLVLKSPEATFIPKSFMLRQYNTFIPLFPMRHSFLHQCSPDSFHQILATSLMSTEQYDSLCALVQSCTSLASEADQYLPLF
jgi:hypothetical protein